MRRSRTGSIVLRRARRAAAVAVLPFALAACESNFTMVAPDVRGATTRTGPAEGSAYSNLALAYPPYACFLPWGWQDRAQLAYDRAVGSAPGATTLSDVTIAEDWTWWLLGTSRKLTIRGDGVKP